MTSTTTTTSEKPISADKEDGAQETARPGEELTQSPEQHLIWEAVSREAMESDLAGRSDDAAALWRHADNIGKSFPDADPRRAASANNLALALIHLDKLKDAEVLLRECSALWRGVHDWTSRMKVTGSARSSLYHLRMELRHRESFNDHIRARWSDWACGAEAATLFNHGVLLLACDRDEQGLAKIRKAADLREKAFGACNPELALMFRTIAALTDDPDETDKCISLATNAEQQPSRSTLERWKQDRLAPLDDQRCLLSAICLTAIVSEREFF